MTKIVANLCLFLVCGLAHAGTQPPKVYIDKGACPFECCTYREWEARQNVELFKAINGADSVGTVRKGEKVMALTGEVHVIPTPMDVVFDHPPYNVGDRIYLLTYEGEGYQKIWFNGKVTSQEVLFLYNFGVDHSCAVASEECWGRIQGTQSSVWWTQIKMKNGTVGWTSKPEHFDGKDACG